MSAPKASVAILENGCKGVNCCWGLLAVSYVVTSRSANELTIQILRVVPAKLEGSLHLGAAVIPSTEEKTSILRRLGEIELALNQPAEAEVPR